MSQHITSFLKDNFGIAEIAIKKETVGASSQTFIVKDGAGKNWLIKKSVWHDFIKNPSAVLEKVYEVGAELWKLGVPLQTAVKGTTDKYVYLLDGAPTVLLPYFDGQPFAGTLENFTATGMALGLFYKAGGKYLQVQPAQRELIKKAIPIEKPYEESRALYKSGFREELLQPHQCSVPAVCLAIRDNIGFLDDVMDSMDIAFAKAKNISEGIMHGDANFGNYLFNKNGSLAYILDIDQLGFGLLILDLAAAILSCGFEFIKNNASENLETRVAALVRAYHKLNPLPATEYALLLPAIQQCHMMKVLRSLRRHRHENDRLPELLPKITERFLPRLKTAPKLFGFLTPTWFEKTLK